jgi:2-polyprenyl-3-methyl-5-hydroxy-6-metoxy-1,4-benzoquinol methylase
MLQKIHSAIHAKAVFGRRIERLAAVIAERIPADARVLDVGCGSGTLAKAIMARRPDVAIEGIDVLVRPSTDIPVTAFDGSHIPFPDKSFDACLIVDVLHHVDVPIDLLREVARVCSGRIVIKDHFRNGFAAGATLRLMDWFGNASHGVRLPYNYLKREEWLRMWQTLGLRPTELTSRIGLYPAPFSWIFDRNLHFVAGLS